MRGDTLFSYKEKKELIFVVYRQFFDIVFLIRFLKKIGIWKSQKGDIWGKYGLWEVKTLNLKCLLNTYTNVNVSIQVFPDEGRLVEIYWENYSCIMSFLVILSHFRSP